MVHVVILQECSRWESLPFYYTEYNEEKLMGLEIGKYFETEDFFLSDHYLHKLKLLMPRTELKYLIKKESSVLHFECYL